MKNKRKIVIVILMAIPFTPFFGAEAVLILNPGNYETTSEVIVVQDIAETEPSELEALEDRIKELEEQNKEVVVIEKVIKIPVEKIVEKVTYKNGVITETFNLENPLTETLLKKIKLMETKNRELKKMLEVKLEKKKTFLQWLMFWK